jgi:quercetin dioxygenase-like cupin family protein
MAENRIIKNVGPKNPVFLKDLIKVEPDSIVSKILVQNDRISMTLFSFGKGQEISTHQSDGDALAQVLEGTGTFYIDGQKFTVQEGQTLLMPHNHPHSVQAEADFKMLLTVVF